MNARWWLPPWGLRPAVVEEELELPRPGLGQTMLHESAAQLLRERDEARANLEVVRDQRNNALARADTVLIEKRALAASLAAARKRVGELEVYAAELLNRSESDEAKAWKRQAEQDRANCQTLTDQLKEQRDANQLLELELAWVMNRALVDPQGAEKVRGAK